MCGTRFQCLEHLRLAFPYRQSAKSIAVEIDLLQPLRRPPAQMRINSALDNAENAWPGPPEKACLDRLAQRSDSMRDFSISASVAEKAGHSSSTIWMSEPKALDLHGPLGRKHVFGTVDMRAEQRALLAHLAKFGQRHDLEAAGIC